MKSHPVQAMELEQALVLAGGSNANVQVALGMPYSPNAVVALYPDDPHSVTIPSRIASRVTNLFHRLLRADHADAVDPMKVMLEALEEAVAHARARRHVHRHPLLSAVLGEQLGDAATLPTCRAMQRLLAAAGPNARSEGIEPQTIAAWAGFVRLESAAACEDALSSFYGVPIRRVTPRSPWARVACRIGPLQALQFQHFRPGGVHLQHLLRALGVFLGPDAAVELTLVIHREHVPSKAEFLRRTAHTPGKDIEVWLSPTRCRRLRAGLPGGLVT